MNKWLIVVLTVLLVGVGSNVYADPATAPSSLADRIPLPYGENGTISFASGWVDRLDATTAFAGAWGSFKAAKPWPFENTSWDVGAFAAHNSSAGGSGKDEAVVGRLIVGATQRLYDRWILGVYFGKDLDFSSRTDKEGRKAFRAWSDTVRLGYWPSNAGVETLLSHEWEDDVKYSRTRLYVPLASFGQGAIDVRGVVEAEIIFGGVVQGAVQGYFVGPELYLPHLRKEKKAGTGFGSPSFLALFGQGRGNSLDLKFEMNLRWDF